ncbi:MAG: hypothetical protein ETSY1_35470 [Candidatus Entotheonella factor]|uniref:Uncharacterized protein n=1 Tax=Entotheonella factor TaxID=1429438 RepID=W4L8I0_ENTF1|nr:hypothetical protein [Candidatus Entotheonella palauensis]ETW94307.1 MAG: hypothetical protein ETSY1_35470 [Candidatus Entotheonella factor]
MTQDPFVNRLGIGYQGGRRLLNRLSIFVSSLWDEGLRLALWWALIMASTICILELCRWFWLIYPETVIGKKYVSGSGDFPDFAYLVLHEPHWYTALFLVTGPFAVSLALAWFSRFFYLKRLFYNPFGSILRAFIWATPTAVLTGYYVIAYIDLTFEAATICAAGPSLALTPQAFRAADRLCPELGDCIRWLRRGLRQLRRGIHRSKPVNAERFPNEHAHF